MKHTIPGFKNLSKQELLNMSVAHVLKNGEPSMRNGNCSYAGIGCAAAPFLKPSGRETLTGSWLFLVNEGRVSSHEAAFVHHLQICHDANSGYAGPAFINLFKRDVLDLCNRFSLQPPKGLK